jgi:hypothetical protein
VEGAAGAAGAAVVAAAARPARVSLVVGREGTGVLFCFLAGGGAIVLVVVVAVLLDCSCISKVLSTIIWVCLHICRSVECFVECCAERVSCDPSTDHVKPTPWSKRIASQSGGRV